MTDPLEPSLAPPSSAGEEGAAPAPDDAPGAAPPVSPPGDTTRRRRSVSPLRAALVALALLAGAGLFLSGFSLGARTAATPGTPAAGAELFAPFWDVYDSITKSYVGAVDRQKLVQGAINGMIGSLNDPFSAYMSPDELKRAQDSIGGEFSGIGATVTTRASDGSPSCPTVGPACRLVVVSTVDGSPARRAGLRADDQITAIDGTTADGASLDQAIGRVRGPKGTTVVLTVMRVAGAPFDVSMVRDTIVTPQVETRDLAQGRVAYVRLAAFSENSAAAFATAIRAARDKGVTRFIVDLRDNPGGFVTAARSIASQFIADGPIFWEEAADGTQVATNAQPGGAATGPDVKVAVLVNAGSASASEIVAGALQDTKRATLVGTTTFGKGTIQEWVDLSAQAGGFRLTIAKWLTPAKRWIHHLGLQPDVVVPTTGAAAPAPGGTGDPFIDAALGVLGAPAPAASPSASPGAGVAPALPGLAAAGSRHELMGRPRAA